MTRKYKKIVHETPDPERVKACCKWMDEITERVIKPWIKENYGTDKNT